MNFSAQIIIWLNALANALGRIFLAPVALLPGWLSATIIAAVTGVLMLVIFKYTSNQRAIKRVRNSIKASLLSLKLFKDSTSVVFKAQGRILWGALQLFLLALVPMLVMVVPVCLLMAQMAVWYQSRPLKVSEESVLTLALKRPDDQLLDHVRLEPTEAVDVLIGPLQVPSQNTVHWRIVARRPGSHQLSFRVADETTEKDVAVGDGFMRTSPLRPGWNWSDALLYPTERPFPPNAPIESISVTYPDRDSWTSGTDWWIVYWFVASMLAAFLFKPLLKVNI